VLQEQVAPLPKRPLLAGEEGIRLALARRLGLTVPDTTTLPGHIPLYLIAPYDRHLLSDCSVVRLHQEDFCLALGVLPGQKYESESGPSLAACFTLPQEKSARPASDRKHLLSLGIFKLLIGNADSHAKDISSPLTAPSSLRSTTFCAVTSTLE
jgi:serine/threonine-protein kinase HipA